MKFCLVIVFSLVSLVVMAQPSDPGGGGNPTVPITGIEILIAAGGALGIRKLIQSRKSK